MLKVVLNDLLINLKKHWIQILLDLIFSIFMSVCSFNIIYSGTTTSTVKPEDISQLVLTNAFFINVLPIISIISLLFLFSVTQKLPLRLSKSMFVCAAGEKEKMKYMFLQLVVKIILSFIFIFAFIYFLTGRVFANPSIAFNIIQLTLWFFIILDLNLKVGIGEQGLKKKDLQGYIIYSKEEEIVNYYWFCLLLLEIIIFYTFSTPNVPITLFTLLVWTVVFIVNIYISYKCISPILKKSLSYEDVYRQIPETKEGY